MLSFQYPNTYMEQFCQAVHPELELGTICVAWFRQATKHCTNLINEAKDQPSFFWTTVKNFIFPERTTELVSQKVPITIHPHRLSIADCQSLFLDIVSDYVQRAPRYAAESTANIMLWQVLYSLMGIMALGSLLVGVIYLYSKYGQVMIKKNLLEEFFKPEKRLQALAKRSLRIAKAELRNIKVKPVAKPEDLVPKDEVQVLALKVGTKYEVLESLVAGSLQSVGKFHRSYDQYNKCKTDFKIESLNKALKFLDNNSKKLHLLVMFEEATDYEEEGDSKKCRNNSPRIKSLSPRELVSPRISSLGCKRLLNTRLEGGSNIGKALSDIESSRRSMSPNLKKITNSPKQATTPRSSGMIGSAIPRNVSKLSPLTKKAKQH